MNLLFSRATSSGPMSSWYKISSFSWKYQECRWSYDFLVPTPRTSCSPDTESRVSAGNVRSTDEPATFSCHLLVPHVLLLQNLEFQLERSSRASVIRAKTFFESLKYQEYRWTSNFLVLPPRTSCSPDTKCRVSARNIRSTDEPATFSCHLLGPHVFPIQNLEFQL